MSLRSLTIVLAMIFAPGIAASQPATMFPRGIQSVTTIGIPSQSLPTSAYTFTVDGYYTDGDLGQGAIYSNVGCSSSGLQAIHDSHTGTLNWFCLQTTGVVYPGWFGAHGDASYFNGVGSISSGTLTMTVVGSGQVQNTQTLIGNGGITGATISGCHSSGTNTICTTGAGSVASEPIAGWKGDPDDPAIQAALNTNQTVIMGAPPGANPSLFDHTIAFGVNGPVTMPQAYQQIIGQGAMMLALPTWQALGSYPNCFTMPPTGCGGNAVIWQQGRENLVLNLDIDGGRAIGATADGVFLGGGRDKVTGGSVQHVSNYAYCDCGTSGDNRIKSTVAEEWNSTDPQFGPTFPGTFSGTNLTTSGVTPLLVNMQLVGPGIPAGVTLASGSAPNWVISGGSLNLGASFTGSILTNTLTVTGTVTGTIAVGQTVFDAAGTKSTIIAFGTGSGRS